MEQFILCSQNNVYSIYKSAAHLNKIFKQNNDIFQRLKYRMMMIQCAFDSKVNEVIHFDEFLSRDLFHELALQALKTPWYNIYLQLAVKIFL